jgi:hypothetical protein
VGLRRAQGYARGHRRQAQPGDQRRARRSQDQGAAAELGGTVLAGSPADFAKLIAEETEKLGKVIRAANINAE